MEKRRKKPSLKNPSQEAQPPATKNIWAKLEDSKIAVGIISALVAGLLVSRRDAYVQRTENLRIQRAALLQECSIFKEKIEVPLIRSTYGYMDYALDVGELNGPGNHGASPAIPPEQIPADKEESVKWKIVNAEKPLFSELDANSDRRKKILALIQNYTIDNNIEIEWRLIDTALDLMPGEDRFISQLWMTREALHSGANSIVTWNQHLAQSGAKAQAEFIKDSPQVFRVYFYQHFVRDHLQKLIELILKEQMGTDSIFPSWLLPHFSREIPAISYGDTIDRIFIEHGKFRSLYLERIRNKAPN